MIVDDKPLIAMMIEQMARQNRGHFGECGHLQANAFVVLKSLISRVRGRAWSGPTTLEEKSVRAIKRGLHRHAHA